jgi:hypothetical protein
VGAVLAVIGYVLLGLLVFILLLPALPVFVRFVFDGELQVRVYVLGLPIYRFSSPAQEHPSPKIKKVKSEEKQEEQGFLSDLAGSLKRDGVTVVLTRLKELARIAVGAVRRVLAALTVDTLQLHLFIAAEDASATAQNTGKVCAVLYPALTTVQSVLRIRRRCVTVTPDFLSQQGRVQADITAHVIPYRLLLAVLIALPAYIKWKKNDTVEEEKQHG